MEASMKRREFLKTTLSLSALCLLPFPAIALDKEKKILVLIELKGGNDGLNTLIPFADPLYAKLRPTIGIKESDILKLDSKIGFHPSMKFLHQAFKNNQLAVIQGVGYENPNLSHFRSIDIWETATESEEYSDQGWLQQLSSKIGDGKELVKGIIVGDNAFGPFRGATSEVLVMDNPKRFLRKNAKLNLYENKQVLPSLKHILDVENSLSKTMEELRTKTEKVELPEMNDLPQDQVAGMIKALLSVLAAGHHVPVFKISIGGFDTHTEQLNQHARLLSVLDQIFQSLEKGLKQIGVWKESTLLTYSEFGRRPAENGSRGTDHGTANVHFAMGGTVRGGLYGKQPSLSNLDGEGNMKFTTDFKSIYSEVCQKVFKISDAEIVKKNKKLPGFLS
jgi:uncharacterized protein (DUF1501 family)